MNTIRKLHAKGALLLGFTLCALVGAHDAEAQISRGGAPQWNAFGFEELPILRMPSIDREALAAQDAVTDLYKEAPWRFGVEYDVNIDPAVDGHWTEEGNERVWRLAVECPEALGISFLFDAYHLPKGGQLFVWSADHDDFIGGFDHRNNKEWGSLALGQTLGDRVVIEYRERLDVAFPAELHISQVVHSYRSIQRRAAVVADELLERGPYGNSGACNVGINCPEGDLWQVEKRSVALILSGGFASCTGALVNNTLQDGTPYFLTANHCLGNPNNWTYLFNHESTSCTGNTGPTSDIISGGTLRASNGGSDVALVELSEVPPASYNVQYAGWDHSGTTPANVTGIHHPSGDLKMYCFDEDGPSAQNQSGAAVWYINQWEIGVTEPGSSGSPLFDENHRIVGQLYGGGAACNGSVNNGQPDWYGRFNVSWDAGGSASTRLMDWLDPSGSNVAALDGWPEGSISYATDATVGVTGLPEEVLCGSGQVIPSVLLTNMGTDELNSATIYYSYNSLSGSSLNWTGSLQQYESQTVELPAMTAIDGTNTIDVWVENPNGVLDENSGNNEITATFTAYAGDTFDFQLALVLDDYGSETTWEIIRLGQVIYSGGPYEDDINGTEVVVDLCLESGCYILKVYDAYGDGMCCQYGDGSWTILDGDGDVVETGGSFNDLDQQQFCTSAAHAAEVESSSLRALPNPAQDFVQLNWSTQEPVEFVVRDVQGREVHRSRSSSGIASFSVADWPNGWYAIEILDASGNRSTSRLIVDHL
jgi:lysyl endopeptidase